MENAIGKWKLVKTGIKGGIRGPFFRKASRSSLVLLRIASDGCGNGSYDGLRRSSVAAPAAVPACYVAFTHSGNWAVLLRSWGAVYSGIGDVRTVGARTIFERHPFIRPLPIVKAERMHHG